LPQVVWFGHDPALNVSARLSSALLSSAPHVSAPAEAAAACRAELSNVTDEKDVFTLLFIHFFLFVGS